MSIPRISLTLVIIVVVAYLVGARYPQLAAKVGLA